MVAISTLGPLDRRRLAVDALVAEKTLRAFLAGDPVRPATEERLQAAAARLGLLLPDRSGPLAPAPVGRRQARALGAALRAERPAPVPDPAAGAPVAVSAELPPGACPHCGGRRIGSVCARCLR